MHTRKELISYLESYVTKRRTERFREILDQRTRFLTIVLEDLYQPHNASAVLRTSECLGIQDVHIVEKFNTFSPNKEIAIGANRWLNIKKYKGEKSIENCLQHLESEQYQIFVTSPHEHSFNLQDVDLKRKSAFVFGQEKLGVSEQLKNKSLQLVKIPVVGMTESYNISVSVAIAMFYLVEKIKKMTSKKEWALSMEEKEEIYLEWLTKSIRNGESVVKHFLDYKKTKS